MHLDSQGWSPELRLLTPEGYVLNLACRRDDVRLAVEVTLPWHHLGSGALSMGRSVGVLAAGPALKRRQLAHFGWVVVPVPMHEWYALTDADDERQLEMRRRYLLEAMAGAITCSTHVGALIGP